MATATETNKASRKLGTTVLQRIANIGFDALHVMDDKTTVGIIVGIAVMRRS